ncbi:MAG TPA: phosphate ABC transporter ATP-binding protein [Syntrophomonadaceae bacterium]|nr:phosphate ABC transporter ATP-binding protein [Syntrophomonadaceae bacterium]
MPEPLFELIDVVKKYDERTVLRVKDLQLDGNKIYAILGPNGAGKSTLLKLLNMLEKPTSGRIIFQGVDLNRAGEAARLRMRRQMCMVLQNTYMFDTSVYQNVAYGLQLRGVRGVELERRVKEALSFVGLSDYGSRRAIKLSGGETQRVALARAVAIRPQVLLLDEPTANLDPDSVALIEKLVRRVHESTGATVLIITHNLFQAQRIADEAILLYNGQVIERAPINQFFTNPQSEITRRFVSGRMVY